MSNESRSYTPISRLDLPGIIEAIQILYRTIEHPPEANWKAPAWLIRQYENTTVGKLPIQEGEIPYHSWLIDKAGEEILNRLTPPFHHIKDDCPEITASNLDQKHKVLLIQLRKYLLSTFLGTWLSSNQSEATLALAFLEDAAQSLEDAEGRSSKIPYVIQSILDTARQESNPIQDKTLRINRVMSVWWRLSDLCFPDDSPAYVHTLIELGRILDAEGYRRQIEDIGRDNSAKPKLLALDILRAAMNGQEEDVTDSLQAIEANSWSKVNGWLAHKLMNEILDINMSRSAQEPEGTPQANSAGASKIAKDGKRKQRGRPVETDLKSDKRIYDGWQTREYANYEELGIAFGISAYKASTAIDRERKRRERKQIKENSSEASDK